MSSVNWQQNGAEVSLCGALTRDTIPELWDRINAWKPEQSQCVLSLRDTSRVDSAGMAMLIYLIGHAKKNNCHIMLRFVPEQLMMLFDLSNVDTLMKEHIDN